MIIRISHSSHLVANMEEALARYKKLTGASFAYKLEIPKIAANIRLIPFGSNFIELIAPLGPRPSGVPKELDFLEILKKRGPGLFNECAVVDDLDNEVRQLRARGVEVIEADTGFPRPIVFVSPKSTGGVLVELVTEEMIQGLGLIEKVSI